MLVVICIISKYHMTPQEQAVLRPICKRAKVLGLWESRLKIRGDKAQDLVASVHIWTSPDDALVIR